MCSEEMSNTLVWGDSKFVEKKFFYNFKEL